jgi:hypothetical protein
MQVKYRRDENHNIKCKKIPSNFFTIIQWKYKRWEYKRCQGTKSVFCGYKMTIIDRKTNDYRIFYGHILFKKHAKFDT